MLREASESERPELRQKLDDLLFNEERPYDRVTDALLDKYFSCSPATIFEMSIADKTRITRMEVPVLQGVFWCRNF
jgi:hypothetical protein